MKHREVWNEENYKAKRTSGLRSSDFANDKSKWADVGDVAVFVVCLVLAVYLMFFGVR